MSKGPFLLVDTNYLCHRAQYTTGELEHDGAKTGVLFGVYKTIAELQDKFDTDRVIWCFDSKHSYRKRLYRGYKASREARYELATPAERALIDEFRVQVKTLRKQWLPSTGFKNIFCVPGYEGDDIIAALAPELRGLYGEVIIVSVDHDLYQCLNKDISMYNPTKRELYTYGRFVEEWGIEPELWAEAKAIAGCKSDCIEGIEGVGEKTAIKYLTGNLSEKTKSYIKITSQEGDHIRERNIKLTSLPLDGFPVEKVHRLGIRKNKVTKEKWARVCESLGFQTINGLLPLGKRQAARAKGVRKRGKRKQV